jgi:FkbM family methyltransferase
MTSFIFDGKRINPEFSLLKKLFAAARGGALIDIGAHIGCYVLEFRRYSNAQIIAFEPSPFVFEILGKNVAINSLEGVEIRRCACGDMNGQIWLNAGINSSISQSGSLQLRDCASPLSNCEESHGTARQEMAEHLSVRLAALDDELESLENISFLKVDCEGFEYHVLSGAKRILDKHRPIVLIELHPQLIGQYGHTPEDVCNLLRPFYKLEFYDFDLARKHNRYVRFLNRYFPNRGHRFSSENSMLNAASSEPVPTQLYIVGYPKSKYQGAQELNSRPSV